MRRRRLVVLALGLLAVLLAVGVVSGTAPLVRWVAIKQVRAVTERPVTIDAVSLNLLAGRITIRGVRLVERDGATPFADIERLDARLRLPALLHGHLRIRQLVIDRPTVRVVRLPGGRFNVSDLVERPRTGGRPLDVTVDRFALNDGTITLEDRALAEPRTWTSEQITIEARDVSTRRTDGRARGRSVTAGAPLAMEISDIRLDPIHLIATLRTEGVDLSPLRLYVPADAPVVVMRGRASSDITVAVDAHDGIRVDGIGRLEDLALGRADGGEPLALIPTLGVEVAGFGYQAGALRLARLTAEGSMSVRATARPGPPSLSRVRASASDLTWPAMSPGHIDVLTGIPGGGTLALAGTLQPPPDASRLHLRVTDANLAPWSQLLPVALRVAGLAEAELRLDGPLSPDAPARVQGAVVVHELSVADRRRELVAVRRLEARGLELRWPRRLVVTRLLISGPRATIERDRAGAISLADLAAAPEPGAGQRGATQVPGPGIVLREVAVADGRLSWRDEAVEPAATLSASDIEASVSNAAWPPQGPLRIRAGFQPPGGGRLRLGGQVAVDPLTIDLRVTGTGAELAPYQPYLPTPARVSGTTDLDVAVTVPPAAERRATVRGSAALSRLDVRDGERTVARIERVAASGLALDWPERLTVGRLALTRPWLLIERDADGALPLRGLLATAERRASARPPTDEPASPTRLAVGVARLSIEGGGARVVDRAVSPPFAVDVDSTTVQVENLSTVGATPARVDLRGRVGAAAEVALRGTVAAFGGPLRVDVSGELSQFAVPRANPYLVRQVGWQTREGRLTTTLHCRVEGEALSAQTEVRVSRLQLVRASNHDEVQARIGLPLGLVTTLMKDRHGDIALSFPVGGRLSDPRFDFRDAVWGAIRAVAVNTITLPVSWIGRVRFTPDSRIEGIQVDPVTFEQGAAMLTPEGAGQVARLAAFLDRLPQVTLKLTPVVSAADAEALKAHALEVALARLQRQAQRPRDEAVRRLFAERFPREGAPDTTEAALSALRERTLLPADALAELATQRLEAVRAEARRAGVDVTRLIEVKARDRVGEGGQVEIDVGEPQEARRSPLREVLRRLGAPLARPDGRE
jgi:uncharacterized protein DUF748/AsmA-like protein